MTLFYGHRGIVKLENNALLAHTLVSKSIKKVRQRSFRNSRVSEYICSKK